MSDTEHRLSFAFLSCGFVIFMLGVLKSLAYILGSLFALPYVDEQLSEVLPYSSIASLADSFSRTSAADYVSFGVLLFAPLLIFIVVTIAEIIKGKKAGEYEFEVPGVFSVLVLFLSGVMYSVITGVSYVCTALHIISIEAFPDFARISAEIFCIPSVMIFIALLLYVVILCGLVIFKLVLRRKEKQFEQLSEEEAA